MVPERVLTAQSEPHAMWMLAASEKMMGTASNRSRKRETPVNEKFTGVFCVGRRDWTRTNDPHHVKVVL
jgi:hypothetical protein